MADTTYQTNEFFQDIKILNNAKIGGQGGETFFKGQLLTSYGTEGDFAAWDGAFTSGINAVMRNDAVIPAGADHIMQPVAIGEMNLTGIAAANKVSNADLEKLKVKAFEGGILLN